MLAPGLPIVLLVLDGFGVAGKSRGNAITLANTPHFDDYVRTYPAATLQASGEVVGLPWGEMGNSEVGHLNIGGGKIVYQSLPFINRAIAEETFFDNKAFLEAIEHAKATTSKLHLMGLLSDGGIHSHRNHLYALLDLCQRQQFYDVVIHVFLDGRDTPHNAALSFVQDLQKKLDILGFGKIATLAGRYWAMDRDNRWDRIEKAYNAIVHGQAERTATDAAAAVEQSYQRNVFDEEFEPTVIVGENNTSIATVQAGDSVVFFNFRADRARQLTKAFVLPTFTKFDRGEYLDDVVFVTLMEYEKNLPVKVAFEPDHIQSPIARVISEAGYRQLHVAETEKYAHVTFFLNGGKEEAYANEDRIMVPSPRVTSYADAPAMSAAGVRDAVVNAIYQQQYHFIVANFANADMVGHTGNLQAAISAVETLDACVFDIVQAALQTGATVVITADHGNAEEMLNLQTGEIAKEHTTNPVPLFIIGQQWATVKPQWPQVPLNDLSQMQPIGVLADLAPTLLKMLGLPIPQEMTARSIF